MERFDGVKLYRTYSDENFTIIQHPTEIEYEEAVDVEDAPYTYTESDRKIEPPLDFMPLPVEENI